MDSISESERETQNGVVAVFRDELGYDYRGDWSDRENSRQIEDWRLQGAIRRHGRALSKPRVLD